MVPLVIIDLLIGTFQTFYKISTSAPPKLRAPTFKEQFSMIAWVIFWQSSSFNNSDVTEKYLRSNIWLSSWIYHWSYVFQGLFCILHMVCNFFSSFWLIYRTMNLWTSCLDVTRFLRPSLRLESPQIFRINWQWQKQPFRGIVRKRHSESMQQIYWRTPMLKCDFNKVANHASAWVFSCKFTAYFQNTFS